MTLTLQIMELEVLVSLSCESHKSEDSVLERAASKKHGSVKMQQGVLVVTEHCEICHLSTELTRVLELL